MTRSSRDVPRPQISANLCWDVILFIVWAHNQSSNATAADPVLMMCECLCRNDEGEVGIGGRGLSRDFFFKTIKTNEVISPSLITCSQSENTVEIQWVTEKVEASFLAFVLLRWRHLIAVAFFRLPPPGYLSHSDECNQRLKRSQWGGLKK